MKGKMSVIKNYEFMIFDEKSEKENSWEKSLDFEYEMDHEGIGKERQLAEINNFDIHPILKEKRGMIAQEAMEEEEIIEQEIQKRLEGVREEAFEKGYQEGKVKGENDVYEQSRTDAREKLDRLGEMIEEVLKSKIKLIKEEKSQICGLLQALTKWIILRELHNDGDYLKRLLDALSQEIGNGSELVVYVDEKNFKDMPEFIDYTKEKLSAFKNVKVEVGYDMDGPGIIICSESEIISGTLEDQLKSLEKVFSSCNI